MWGLPLDKHPPSYEPENPYWFSVTVDLDKRGEDDSSMVVSQIKLNGNVVRVRIEVRTTVFQTTITLSYCTCVTASRCITCQP